MMKIARGGGFRNVGAEPVSLHLRAAPADQLGIATMCVFVAVINRAFWRPLYYYAERRYRLD